MVVVVTRWLVGGLWWGCQVDLYRTWKARKTVRELITRRFKKKFDPTWHECYYENIR